MSRNRHYQENLMNYSKSSSSTISDDEDESLLSEESLIHPDELSNYDVKYEKVIPSPKVLDSSNKMKINHRFFWPLLIFGILGIVIAVNSNKTEHRQPSMKELNPFNHLKERFPSQSKNFWRSLEIVLDHALNKSNSQPNIVLFISNGKVFPGVLLNGIVETTKFWLGNNVDPVELTKTDFTSDEIDEDYGAFLNIYKPKLTDSRFMIVRDLNDIPANAAQAFHSFCDVYNPAVKRAVIFFTMKVDDDFVGAENATKIAEKLLKRVWNVLELNVLQPLIGRVTDNVLVIKQFN